MDIPIGGRSDAEHNVSVLDAFQAAVRDRPKDVAIQYRDRAIAYSELDARSADMAAALAARGIGRGDRVACALPNIPQFVVIALGVWRLGCVLVPINPMYRERELAHQLGDSGARLAFCTQEKSAELAAAAPGVPIIIVRPDDSAGGIDFGPEPHEHRPSPVVISAEDHACLMYTSGTTGVAKAAILTHGNIGFNSQVARDWLELNPHSVVLAIAPLFHITAALYAQCSVLMNDRFEPAVTADLCHRYSATHTVASITVFNALLASPEVSPAQLASLTHVVSGGAPVPASIVARFAEWSGSYIHNAYGLTESTSVALRVPFGTTAPVDPESGAVSVGFPTPGTEVGIADADTGELLEAGRSGEVVVRGPHVMAGYWHNPSETAATIRDGWLRTGDIGLRDRDGWVFIVDRIKDIINASGYKVSPREVEGVLLEHPNVHEVCVVGAPDAYRGETVVAYLQLSNPDTTPGELETHCRERLAAYKVPRRFIFVDALPKSESGKLLHRELRDRSRRDEDDHALGNRQR
jgi:long-chain acyl-CoA synthetase